MIDCLFLPQKSRDSLWLGQKQSECEQPAFMQVFYFTSVVTSPPIRVLGVTDGFLLVDSFLVLGVTDGFLLVDNFLVLTG